MSIFMVSYDLNSPGQNYEKVSDAIKSIGGYCKVLKSAWLVSSRYATAESVYEVVHAAMDSGDHLLVSKVTKAESQGWLPKNIWEWWQSEAYV